MSKTNIDWTDTITNMELDETLFFYAKDDNFIINNLLCGTLDSVWEVVELVVNDNKGMLKEHEDGVRTLDKKSIERFQSRIYEKIDDEAKAKIIKTAKNDISIILNAMKPTKNKIMLYRIISITSPFRAHSKSLSHNVNDIVEFKNISSTSIAPFREFAGDTDFYEYEITVPENGYVLELDELCHNEDGEVLLPPMKCKITNIRTSDNEKCKGIIELEYIEKLPINF